MSPSICLEPLKNLLARCFGGGRRVGVGPSAFNVRLTWSSRAFSGGVAATS